MELAYKIFNFRLRFLTPLYFDVYPAFVFRSLIGMELHRIACAFTDRICDGCSVRAICPYAFMFESPIDKANEAITGRNRAGHPFALFCHDAYQNQVEEIRLELSLFGRGIDYFPYIFHALASAGHKGVLRSRTRYIIVDVDEDGVSLTAKRGKDGSVAEISAGTKARTWIYGGAEPADRPLTLTLLSPLRLKVDGRYTMDFSADSLFARLFSRARMLSQLYGHINDTSAAAPAGNFVIAERKTTWLDLTHYSARQGKKLRMGGALGNFALASGMDRFAMSLLRFGRVFHAGKNPSFGLGVLGYGDE